jgi:hypothetical protein
VLAKAPVPEGFDHYLTDFENALEDTAPLKTVTGLQARAEASTRYTQIAHHGEQHTPAAARLAALSRPTFAPPASVSPDQTRLTRLSM